MKHFLLGLLLGLSVSGCALKQQSLQLVPVLSVPAECPATQELPYLLGSDISDDDIVCVDVWREQPLEPVVCMKAGKLKALIVSLKGA